MRARRRQERGHTLLELLVAATLVGVLGIVFGLAGRFTSGETLRMRQRARAAGELHAVVEHLRQDLARAATVTYDRSGTLRVTPERPVAGLESAEAWSSDAAVEYTLEEGRLLRTELPEQESTVVALGIAEFALSKDDDETHVRIAAGEGHLKRQITLVWEP